MKKHRRKKGFTLIEVMIVVAIIGILAAIAIPRFATYRQRAQDSAAKSALHNLAKAQENYYFQHETYTLDKTALYNVSGWLVEPSVTINILAADTESWSATGQHNASSNTWTYSSSAGGMQ